MLKGHFWSLRCVDNDSVSYRRRGRWKADWSQLISAGEGRVTERIWKAVSSREWYVQGSRREGKAYS